jgi:hypothetical protein
LESKTHEHYSSGYNSVIHKVLKHQLWKIVCGCCISFSSITFKSHVWRTKKGTNYFTRVRPQCCGAKGACEHYLQKPYVWCTTLTGTNPTLKYSYILFHWKVWLHNFSWKLIAPTVTFNLPFDIITFRPLCVNNIQSQHNIQNRVKCFILKQYRIST